MAVPVRPRTILIVDDEWESAVVKAVRRRIESEGWRTIPVEPETPWLSGDEFELAALSAIQEQRPDGFLLDVRFGEHKDDQFKGLGILQTILHHHPKLPVLMFTQYAGGAEREMAVRAGHLAPATGAKGCWSESRS